MQQDAPEDFVIATGVTTSVREFVRLSFEHLGIYLAFKGENENEVGYVDRIDRDKLITLDLNEICKLKIGDELVSVDSRYFRPTEVDLLIGDPSKSYNKLGWKPKYNLQDLVQDMMQNDLSLMKRSMVLKKSGFEVLSQFE